MQIFQYIVFGARKEQLKVIAQLSRNVFFYFNVCVIYIIF